MPQWVRSGLRLKRRSDMAQAISGCVHIVEDEDGVRATIATIVQAAGFGTREYGTADALLSGLADLEQGCIITDVRMPGMNGLELMRHLNERGVGLPVIVVSGNADIALAVEAMKAGARDFLEKPLYSGPLQEAVRTAMLGTAARPNPAADRYARVFETLTRRQREVLAGIMEGLPNKLIAYRLGLSVRTVESYRAAIMERTQAKSLSELVRMGIQAGI